MFLYFALHLNFFFQRKEEKELALYGKLLSEDTGNNEEGEKEEEEPELATTIAGKYV